MKLKIQTEQDRKKAIEAIQAISLETTWLFSLTKRRKRRTLSQNRLLWLWLTCLEVDAETGYTKEELYQYFLNIFPTRRFVMDKEIIITSSVMETKEKATFLDAIQRFAGTELGIVLPDPEGKRFEEFENQYGHLI